MDGKNISAVKTLSIGHMSNNSYKTGNIVVSHSSAPVAINIIKN